MGLMDKVKAQATVLADKAQTGMQQGQSKIQEMQTGRQVDHLLRDIGAYVFLSERGRPQPDAEAKVADLMSELDALETGGTPVTISNDGTAPGSGTQAGTQSGSAGTHAPGADPTQAGGAIPKSGGLPT